MKGLAEEAIVSVETYEPDVVRACLDAGARILNMTGRQHEDEMLALAAEYDAAVVMCFGETANVREIADVPPDADPIPVLLDHFAPRLAHARSLGVDKVVIDPGMGFYYGNLVDPLTRARHQARVLAQGFRLRPLGVPVCNVRAPHLRHLRRRVPQGRGLLRRPRRPRRHPPRSAPTRSRTSASCCAGSRSSRSADHQKAVRRRSGRRHAHGSPGPANCLQGAQLDDVLEHPTAVVGVEHHLGPGEPHDHQPQPGAACSPYVPLEAGLVQWYSSDSPR